MENSEKEEKTWYERVMDTADLPRWKNPALQKFLSVEKMPQWAIRIFVEITSQTTPAIRIKELKKLTPENVGRFLGQKCANVYALGDRVSSVPNPEIAAKNACLFETLEKQKEKPGVASFLHVAKLLGLMILNLTRDIDKVEKHMLKSFKMALEQPSHEEALQFFQGFAKGLAQKGNHEICTSEAQSKMLFATL